MGRFCTPIAQIGSDSLAEKLGYWNASPQENARLA
jgi:hypothetical protein